jgi:acetyl-CoA acetyltransferase
MRKPAFDMRGAAAIIGVGQTPFLRRSEKSAMGLTAEAFKAALADAGVSRDDVDGYASNYGAPVAVDFDRFAEAMGLNIRYAVQFWSHGRFVTSTLQSAAMAVAAGLADIVACVVAVKFLDVRGGLGGDGDHENLREGGGSHGEEPAHGFTSPSGGAAIGFQRYVAEYGLDPGLLYHTVAGARAHAARNPRSIRKEPFSREVYEAEPWVIEPLRRADCSLLNDAAVVVLVASADVARSLSRPAVYIRGMQGMRAGRDEFVFAPRGLGVSQQGLGPSMPDRDPMQALNMAGVGRGDVRGLYTYDAFSPLIPFVLERFGYCRPGRALHFAADGETGPGGRLPVNTAGGLLAEAHVAGWNSIAEIVRQARGEAGPTQLPRADVLQWATAWGDSVVFGAEP